MSFTGWRWVSKIILWFSVTVLATLGLCTHITHFDHVHTTTRGANQKFTQQEDAATPTATTASSKLAGRPVSCGTLEERRVGSSSMFIRLKPVSWGNHVMMPCPARDACFFVVRGVVLFLGFLFGFCSPLGSRGPPCCGGASVAGTQWICILQFNNYNCQPTHCAFLPLRLLKSTPKSHASYAAMHIRELSRRWDEWDECDEERDLYSEDFVRARWYEYQSINWGRSSK